MDVDRSADRSAVRQIADALRDLIERDILVPGDELPAPRDIAHETGVHVHTARAAIRMLCHEGLAHSVPGHGTVVQGEQPKREVELPGTVYLTARMPTQPEVQALDIPSGVPLLVVWGEQDGEQRTGQYLADRTTLVTGRGAMVGAEGAAGQPQQVPGGDSPSS